MLKELQRQLQEEFVKMKTELADEIKGLLSEENVQVEMADDLSQIVVVVSKGDRNDDMVKNTEYVFNYYIEEKPDEEGNPQTLHHREFSATATELILKNGRVVGTSVATVSTEIQLINMVFQTILDFKTKKEEPEQPSE